MEHHLLLTLSPIRLACGQVGSRNLSQYTGLTNNFRAIESMRQSAQLGCGFALYAGILAPLLLGGALGAQIPDPALLAIEPILRAESAELRGEAALALASTGEERHYQAVLALASDPEPAARQRALLALGYLGRPGPEALLRRILTKAPRDSVDRLSAAIALGLLPDEPRLYAIDEFFERASGASQKRVNDEFICLLLGMAQRPHPLRQTILEEYLEDDTYRDDDILALVITALARTGTRPTAALIGQLSSENNRITEAVLRGLAQPDITCTEDERREIIRLAKFHRSDRVRSAALDLLTYRRDAEALELASEAIADNSSKVAAAAVRAILKLGGGTMREQAAQTILETRDPKRQAEMLRAKSSPHRKEFVDACLSLATDTRQDLLVRICAAKIAAEAGHHQIAPVLRRLFLEAQDLSAMSIAASALQELDSDLDNLPTKTIEDLAQLQNRLRALLGAGHKGGTDNLLRILDPKKAGGDYRLEAVRAYRLTRLEPLTRGRGESLPPVLKEILDGFGVLAVRRIP